MCVGGVLHEMVFYMKRILKFKAICFLKVGRGDGFFLLLWLPKFLQETSMSLISTYMRE